MTTDTAPETRDLLTYIEAGPTPWHCVAETERRLASAGFSQVAEDGTDWPTETGSRCWATRGGGSLIAWRVGSGDPRETGFRIIGAHTDSPNLRIKPRPDIKRAGSWLLGVEPYGGVLLSTWTDRDLSIAGRVTLRREEESLRVETRLLRVQRPVCRIPNLAIHLNRGVNDDGLKLNKQKHLPALWSLTRGSRAEDGEHFKAWLADEIQADADRILGWDLALYDTVAPCISGVDGEFIHAPRLDNQASCHAALEALLTTAAEDTAATQVIALFDHEEIGSRTSRGAASTFLRDVLTRLTGAAGSDLHRAISHSFVVSADMAHGHHPNYSDKHDAQHRPQLNGGPVLKTHNEWRYASDSEDAAIWRGLCADAGVPMQEFVNRSDLRCGSTIGPIVSTELGIRGVDVGNAMLSMHSIREMAGSEDQPMMISVMSRFLQWAE
ncbi:MAG: M18 family aminopeptidase [Myxococcota bacterium]|nr:M18 family aminopeptidase [Myxococcota bacterium]